MAALPLTVHALHKAEMEHHAETIMQPVFYQLKLWHMPYLVFKLSSSLFNIWIVTHINPSFILLVIMMAQMSS